MTDKQTNYLELSDEELMNLPEPEIVDEPQEENEDEEVVAEAAEEEGTEEQAADTEEDDEEVEASDEEAETEPEEAAAGSGDTSKADESDGKKEDKQEESKEGKKADEQEPAPVNYEAEYKRLMGTFKANGREITPKSVDDAISLMQMGANYNKKMAALKPNLRLMKMLENNGLLDEEKLSFLIDLDKKSPEAISKLIKDSNLDPMYLDAEKASGYQKTSYTVDEREIDLDQVLEEIKDTPSYTRTLDIVGNTWDSASKQVIAQQPELLRVINDHIERGIYDLISKEVENERLFGRLKGLSSIEAYRHVGDAIQARGGFNHLVSSQGKSETVNQVVEPKSSKADEESRRQKRRAASPTKPNVSKKVDPDFNPLALSDEAFEKMVNQQYL